MNFIVPCFPFSNNVHLCTNLEALQWYDPLDLGHDPVVPPGNLYSFVIHLDVLASAKVIECSSNFHI